MVILITNFIFTKYFLVQASWIIPFFHHFKQRNQTWFRVLIKNFLFKNLPMVNMIYIYFISFKIIIKEFYLHK